jgi:hypothetical protein
MYWFSVNWTNAPKDLVGDLPSANQGFLKAWKESPT